MCLNQSQQDVLSKRNVGGKSETEKKKEAFGLSLGYLDGWGSYQRSIQVDSPGGG